LFLANIFISVVAMDIYKFDLILIAVELLFLQMNDWLLKFSIKGFACERV
jgi:hypothetical protein